MCTAITFTNGPSYFGRNLDLEYSYTETVTIAPRHFPFSFRCGENMNAHYAMIGMAFVNQNTPLYYDATNEKGLSMAGLHFLENAVYQPVQGERYAASYELIPWLLCRYETVEQVKDEMKHLTIADLSFSDDLPATPLHWLVADRKDAITIETVAEGIRVYENPVGVLTNNPPFDYHLNHLAQYLNLTSDQPVNRFSDRLNLQPFSVGMGAMGLPGDLSSPSRFVRAAFTRWNSRCAQTEMDNISQFFHILGSVEQTRGCAKVKHDLYEITHYSSCCNMDTGVYYYRTYTNSQISAVDMHRENLDGDALISYPLNKEQQIAYQN